MDEDDDEDTLLTLKASMTSKQFVTPFIVALFLSLILFSKYQLEHQNKDQNKHKNNDSTTTSITIDHKDTSNAHLNTSSAISNNKPNNDHPPKLTRHDLIYNNKRNTVPIVNEEYKTIFFQVAKVASSEWTRFFIRLNNDPGWCSNDRIHDPQVNGLKYLSDYPIKEARQMMLSPEWTKAIFVRHPKPRILSAFLDKAIEKSEHFVAETCKVYWAQKQGTVLSYEDCLNYHENFDFFLHEITTTLKDNVHWRSIYSRVDEKWWPYMTHIGYMESLSDDAKTFLQSIHSDQTGKSAWEAIGTSGWSDNERDCANTERSNGEFLAKRDIKHTTRARDKMLKYYTPELEEFVENHYKDDLENDFFSFKPIQLFKVDEYYQP